MHMNSLFILLQAQPQQPQGSSASMWIMLLLIFVVMWLFMIRPQRKQQKELEAFQNSLKKGDKVVIGNSGIFGEIAEVNDKTALVRVDGDTKLRVSKQVLLLRRRHGSRRGRVQHSGTQQHFFEYGPGLGPLPDDRLPASPRRETQPLSAGEGAD